jgi:acyl-homoserine-lactone acylase
MTNPILPAAVPAPRWRRWLRWGLLALVGLALVAAVGLLLIDLPYRPRAPDLKPLLLRGAAYDVHIRRDQWGVPHVRGQRDADVAFGLAYAHAEDDYRTVEAAVLAARGTLAARDGIEAAPTDFIGQLLNTSAAVARSYGTLPADLRAVLDAYADGLNYYAARHPAAFAPGAVPYSGQDIAASFAFKTPFFYNLDRVFRDLTTPPVAPPPARDNRGSNGVAVAPLRSSDGATRLLLNSHQPFEGPAAWYEAVLQSDEGWHVAGGFFPGSPFLLYGHNADLGWATTVNKPDLVDVYRLVLNPANPQEYRLDGRWLRFQTGVARIRIKLFGPFFWTTERPLLTSRHGPVFINEQGAFAVRFAGQGEIRQTLQYYRMNKAKNIAEWRAALALRLLPNINYVYADRVGNIAMVYSGQYPERKDGLDWSQILPGDRSDLIWTRYQPFAKTPQLWNPACGLLFNTNNDPTIATACADDGLRRTDLDPTMGIPTDMNNRALRVQETYGRDGAISEAAFERYKYDLRYSARSEEMALVRGLIAADARGDPDLARAQGVLKNWDGQMNAGNRSAALAQLTAEIALVDPRSGKIRPTAREALRQAMAQLQSGFGRLDPKWGEVNLVRRGARKVAMDGGRETFRAAWGRPEPDGTIKVRGGDSLIMFVAWDKAGRLSSRSIHPFGSATLDAESPHYADQLPMFIKMQTKPVAFTEAELAGHVSRDYRPQDNAPAKPAGKL